MALIPISRALCKQVQALRFGEPIAYVYNPLQYAQIAHEQYLERFGKGKKQVLLLGMNPGPWGMAQTGVPFGEVNHVRSWLGIDVEVGKPEPEHPKRPVLGLQCARSEVSGARLWGWAKTRFGTAENFFQNFFVYNYCPLAFMEASARNYTPDKLPKVEQNNLFKACDEALRQTVDELKPALVIGVGAFAEQRAKHALDGDALRIGRILHPSPASPLANKNWAQAAEAQLRELGVRL